jgi:hypothetical protein
MNQYLGPGVERGTRTEPTAGNRKTGTHATLRLSFHVRFMSPVLVSISHSVAAAADLGLAVLDNIQCEA